ncbi:hypothetical protein [Virgibacillus salexigens]|uniref:hypothetical protein n=1 Tax=Virgibacillus salexigens TaxID=61016 RepID=UPI0030819E68
MKYTYLNIMLAFVCTMVLSGCLYPQDELSKNQVPNQDQLETVQSAVDQYKEKNQGLVPIRTKPSDTPIFQKYLIDFSKLKEANVLTEIPGNAYENGGVYQYTLINPEENPQVKLIDLQTSEAIRSVNVKLDMYRNDHIYPPFGEEINQGIYTIDYEKLGMKSAPTVNSPYSNQSLPIVMDVDGNLYVDYRIDLNNALSDYEHHYQPGDDIRYILTDHTPFVPVYSFPYAIKDGEPVFNPENK